MKMYWKTIIFASFLLILIVLSGSFTFSQEHKEMMQDKGKTEEMMGMRKVMAEMDSMMANHSKMMKEMMGKGMMKDSTSAMDMHSMMTSMQNMMQCMKGFMGKIDSSMKSSMMQGDRMKKNLLDMQETMEHMSEHLPDLMKNMQDLSTEMQKMHSK